MTLVRTAIGLLVPVLFAVAVLLSVVRGDERAADKGGTLGVSGYGSWDDKQTLSSYFKKHDLPPFSGTGLLVTKKTPLSCEEILLHDIILKVGSRSINDKRDAAQLGSLEAGKSIAITVKRLDQNTKRWKTTSFEVTPPSRDAVDAEIAELRRQKSIARGLASNNEAEALLAAGMIISETQDVESLSEATAEKYAARGAEYFPKVKTITPEVARALAKGKTSLVLGLTELTPEVARELALHKGWRLEFSQLSELDAASASLLADHEGAIDFPILRTMSADAAKSLASHKGTLNLPRLPLTNDVAMALSSREAKTFLSSSATLQTTRDIEKVNKSLSLSGLDPLEPLSPDAITALRQNKNILFP